MLPCPVNDIQAVMQLSCLLQHICRGQQHLQPQESVCLDHTGRADGCIVQSAQETGVLQAELNTAGSEASGMSDLPCNLTQDPKY